MLPNRILRFLHANEWLEVVKDGGRSIEPVSHGGTERTEDDLSRSMRSQRQNPAIRCCDGGGVFAGNDPHEESLIWDGPIRLVQSQLDKIMNKRCVTTLAAALAIQALFGGCVFWNVDRAPAGFSIVREHIISSPQNDPPVTSTLDFTLTEIDGAAVTRERIPPWVDMNRGALMSAGAHQFKAAVAPHLRPHDFQPKEVSFAATVASGKVYFLVDDKDGAPVLVEEHLRSR
jgi:hypothetical protein